MINRRTGMSMSIAIAYCISAPMSDINEYTKPVFKKKQSWQAMNKGNLSKKQRRK